MNRRGWMAGAAGAAALAAGAWVALRREGAAVDDDGSAAFWAQELELPGGGRLALDGLRGRPTVVNFWATWCAPCLREMPQLDRFHRQQTDRGWQVIGVAIDTAEPVRAFLDRTPVGFAIGLAGTAGLQTVRALGNDAGALPFTVLLRADGRVGWRKLGETNFEELIRETAQIA